MSFGPEWIIVLGILVLLFGAKKLPELARSLGKSSNEFKKGMYEGASAADDEDTAEPKAENTTD
ncbi:MAG: twin-arginine translocase TatA/TatE family subunit [Actinomycetota bacterium]